MKYRIIADKYCGFAVQGRLLIFWINVGSTYISIEDAEKFIKEHCGYTKKKFNKNGDVIGTVVKTIDASEADQLIWKLKDE